MSQPFLARPDLSGHFGFAASTHWLASQTALSMLERGGNAFDAVVAGGFVLQVVEPHLNGPLGEVPILLHDASSGDVRVICGQGPAPAGATIAAFQDLGLQSIPGTGLLAAAIPGAFDAWMLLARDYGSLPLQTLLMPAIEYAEHGVPVIPKLHKSIMQLRDWFEAEWPENAAIYMPGGRPPAPGSLLRNPVLASMYRRLVEEATTAASDREEQFEAARGIWRQGFVAEAIDRFCRTAKHRDVTGTKHTGLLTGEDIANWSATYEAPMSGSFRGHTICKTGPWGQGPVLLQGLALAEKVGLDGTGPNDVEFYHRIIELMKLTYADRDTYFGDPKFIDVPFDELLSDRYLDQRAAMISAKANNEWRPGAIAGYGHPVDYDAAANMEVDAEVLARTGLGEPTSRADTRKSLRPRHGDTCHINVVDRHGNMVAATPSGGWMESSPVIPELGVCLGTRLQMMSLVDGAPDALQPGKRPRTTLTPTLILNADGKPYMACGTPGGDKQDQWQLAFLIRHLMHGQSPQEAIEMPGFSSAHWPNSFYPRQAEPGSMTIESRAGEDVITALRKRGHKVTAGDPWSEGWICATSIEADGQMRGAASPRGMQAYVSGR